MSLQYLQEMGIQVWVSRPLAAPAAFVVDEPADAEPAANTAQSLQADSATREASAPGPSNAGVVPLHVRQYGDWVLAAATTDPLLDQIAMAIHGRSIRGVKLSGRARHLIVLGEVLTSHIAFAADDTIIAASLDTLRESAVAKRQLWRDIQQRLQPSG